MQMSQGFPPSLYVTGVHQYELPSVYRACVTLARCQAGTCAHHGEDMVTQKKQGRELGIVCAGHVPSLYKACSTWIVLREHPR
jgi:hypothetical protein